MDDQNRGVTKPSAARTVSLPDGLTRIVSLHVGWWDCLDWMVKRQGVSLQEMVAACWRYVERHSAYDFADMFEYYIHCYMEDHLAGQHTLANDNYGGPAYLWDELRKPYLTRLEQIPAFCAGKISLANDNQVEARSDVKSSPCPYRIKLTKIPSFCAG